MFDANGRHEDHDTETNDATETDWKRAHEDLKRLARDQCGLDLEIGRGLLRALRSSAHLRLGFGSFVEYGGRLLGCSPRMVTERLRVAEALETLPAIAAALEQGKLSWSAVRELTRVANPRTEQEWLRAASGRTLREVERCVAGRKPGDRPEDPADPALQKHVLHIELSAETIATYRDAMAKVRRDASEKLDDDAAFLLLARCALGGPTDDGRASYQVLLQVCPSCRRGEQEANGERVEVNDETIEMACCDGQIIDEPSSTHVGAKRPKRATQTIPPAVRRAVRRRDNRCCRVPGCRHTRFVDVHHLDPRAEGGGHAPENLITLCGAHHRALHRREIIASGSATSAIFRHADGTQYGGEVNPSAAETSSKLLFALRHLGFGESESRRALEAVATHVGQGEPLEKLIPRALAILVKPAAIEKPQRSPGRLG